VPAAAGDVTACWTGFFHGGRLDGTGRGPDERAVPEEARTMTLADELAAAKAADRLTHIDWRDGIAA